MVLDNLGSSLRTSLDKLRGASRVDEEIVDEVNKEIQRGLLRADVEVELVSELNSNIKERALEEEPPSGTSARDYVLKVVYEELVDFIGQSAELELQPQTILLAGLQGSGKTTSAAKIAWWFSKKGLKPAIIQTDTFRPGAYTQAEKMADKAEVMFYGDSKSDNPAEVAKNGLEETKDADIRIIDTAGRSALNQELIEEIESIESISNPDHNILVLDAAIGQDAKEQAREFQKSIGIDSITITKLDGSAKGGGALAAIRETGSSISFIGTGEQPEDIERFEPEGFISRLLGMGDLKQLSERVERAYDSSDNDDWEPEDVLEGDFTLVDMKHQVEAMNQMGALDDILGMMPGMGGMNIQDMVGEEEIGMTEEKMKKFDIIMDSMTQEEMEEPQLFNNSRVIRVARGSGTSTDDVIELLEHYEEMESMLGQFDKDKMEQMQEQFGGLGGLGKLGRGPF